ncbi:hypothetical protein B0J11DRAFT_502212 [Dendryphion nanum]|uniref:Uncharacterized protein n=1 Tax=Dendryphion nanum TaxID=256645 RepID=A0A9P9EE13_9PLEO|nr:hypothetical protein B0J11DRAFT_502212 [Dendryphion nanum]
MVDESAREGREEEEKERTTRWLEGCLECVGRGTGRVLRTAGWVGDLLSTLPPHPPWAALKALDALDALNTTWDGRLATPSPLPIGTARQTAVEDPNTSSVQIAAPVRAARSFKGVQVCTFRRLFTLCDERPALQALFDLSWKPRFDLRQTVAPPVALLSPLELPNLLPSGTLDQGPLRGSNVFSVPCLSRRGVFLVFASRALSARASHPASSVEPPAKDYDLLLPHPLPTATVVPVPSLLVRPYSPPSPLAHFPSLVAQGYRAMMRQLQ